MRIHKKSRLDPFRRFPIWHLCKIGDNEFVARNFNGFFGSFEMQFYLSGMKTPRAVIQSRNVSESLHSGHVRK